MSIRNGSMRKKLSTVIDSVITNIDNAKNDITKETMSSSFNIADYFFISFQIAKERYHCHQKSHHHYHYHYYYCLD